MAKRNQGRRLRKLADFAFVSELMGPGLSPLQYLTAIFRDEDPRNGERLGCSIEARVAAAAAVAPFVHRKQPVSTSVEESVPMRVVIECPAA